ncbi:MAG: hypothetical protein K2H75_07950 [Muribaculaceae bacterium]|nr:hypothetical protein [Muribaculaceae bacterium]
MKRLLIIIDGMDDEPVAVLGDRTPAQCANMEGLTFMREHGSRQYVRSVPEGVEPATDTALLTQLGYQVTPDFCSRAWLEALGNGINPGPADLCLRCNLINHDGQRLISHSAGHPGKVETKAYVEMLGTIADERFTVYDTGNYRSLLVIHNTSAQIYSIPPHKVVGLSLDFLKVSGTDKKTVDTINRFITEARSLPAVGEINGIAVWGAGRAFIPAFTMAGAVVTAVPVVKGIAKAVGMEVIEVNGATGDASTDYEAKLQAAIKAFDVHDFVLLHIEAPDEASHARNPVEKVRILHDIDNRILRPLLDISMPLQITVQADHATSSVTGCHLAIPVEQIRYNSHLMYY